MTRKRTIRRIVVLVVLAGLLVVGRRAWPRVNREIHFQLAEQAIAENRLKEAEARLDLLIAEEPRQTRARLLEVTVLRRQGRITEAEETLQRAVELGLPIEQGRREHDLLRAGTLNDGRSQVRR